MATRRTRSGSSPRSISIARYQRFERAEEGYRKALALAEELGMRPLQAHCHRGLGRLYQRRGDPEAGATAAAAARELYRAMDMTFWLDETEFRRRRSWPQPTTSPILPEAMLQRFRERAPGYDRENRFFQEDFDELRGAGLSRARRCRASWEGEA